MSKVNAAQNQRIQWVYSSRNPRELEERYNQWAGDYDRDLTEAFGWTGPRAAAEVLARHVSPEARVLDAGAGTGLVGAELAKLGFGRITGIDLSDGMLGVARKTGAYEALRREVLGTPLGFATGEFDAVISVGVLTVGHAPPESLDELVRVTTPGGIIVFSMRPDYLEPGGFQDKQTQLEQADRWRLVERGRPFRPIREEPEVEHEVWVYQVGGKGP